MSKKIKIIKQHLIDWFEIYVSMPGLDWTQRFELLLHGPATMLLLVIGIVTVFISDVFRIFVASLYFVWLLIFFLKTFYLAYSIGIEVAENPKPKTIKLKNTWLSHIYHAGKTLILLYFVISFFPWYIMYRFGKRKGRRDYCIRKKEYREPTYEKEIDAWRKFRDSRAQHYVFVHRVLRDLFFDSPEEIIAILRDEGRNDSLLDLWNKVGKKVRKSRLVSPNGLRCEIRMLGDTIIVIITLPTPQVLPEAYFVALVYRPSSPEQKGLTRFIILEHSVDLDDGSLPTVLCEWDGTGVHANMGYGCEPTLEDFFQAVCNLL